MAQMCFGTTVASPPQVARLLIANDHTLITEGLRTMLSGEVAIEVIAEANDGRQALTLCRKLRPDLVLMDVRMPVRDGLEATKKIKQEGSDERRDGDDARNPRLPL